MGPIGVWGPRGMKGWWTGLKGQPHHLPQRGPCGLKGPSVGAAKTLGGWLGDQASPAAGPKRARGTAPLATYIRRGWGRAAAPLELPPALAAAPLPCRTTSPWRHPSP